MKTGEASAATLGLVGGLALGAWIGAEMTSLNSRDEVASAPAAVTTPAAAEPAALPAPAKARRAPRIAPPLDAPAPESAPRLVMTIPVSAPELHQRIKPVMAPGTKLPIAVEGFTSAEQFAATAHAARNTQVPFMLLKHRVLVQGQSLEDAIRASRPEIDAKKEALKAKGEARADILSVSRNSTASNNN